MQINNIFKKYNYIMEKIIYNIIKKERGDKVSRIDDAFKLLEDGLKRGVYPGAVACVGDRYGIIKSLSLGTLGKNNSIPVNHDTMFDLASLTKVVATTPIIVKMLEQGKISLYDLVSDYLEEFRENDELRIIHLLTHTSGFEAFSDLYNKCDHMREVVEYISKSKRTCQIGKEVVYSDYNFILLKEIAEKILNKPFEVVANEYVFEPLSMNNTKFNPKNTSNIACTEFDSITGRYLKGIVHDENARFFGGVSGHAGLFSNIKDLSKYCEMYLNLGRDHVGKMFMGKRSIDMIRHNYTYGLEESRGIGFCVKDYENSSGGELMSKGAIGHTGFTGTSMWIDFELGVYIVLLSNRVNLGRENNKIIKLRRHFHNAVINSIEEKNFNKNIH